MVSSRSCRRCRRTPDPRRPRRSPSLPEVAGSASAASGSLGGGSIVRRAFFWRAISGRRGSRAGNSAERGIRHMRSRAAHPQWRSDADRPKSRRATTVGEENRRTSPVEAHDQLRARCMNAKETNSRRMIREQCKRNVIGSVSVAGTAGRDNTRVMHRSMPAQTPLASCKNAKFRVITRRIG